MLSGNAAAFEPNYDEAKVPASTLPDPLVAGGVAATDREDWERRVRPATLRLFEREMDGRVPGSGDGLLREH